MPTIFRDKVVVGSVTFNDPITPPLPAGVVSWGLDVLTPWDTTPDMDAQFTPLGSVDGEVSSDFFPLSGKQVTVGGWGMATDRVTAQLLTDLLVRDAFPRNTDLVIVRHEPVPKSITARRNAPVEVSWVGPNQFRWGTQVRAADPFRYSVASSGGTTGVAGTSSGGRSYSRTYPLTYTTITSGEDNKVAVINSGTGESRRLLVVITGPLNKGGWRLVNETTGALLKFDVGLVTGDVLEIDMKAEIALLNGAPVTATITGDWFGVEPGTNILKLYGDFDPAAGFTATAYSAWE